MAVFRKVRISLWQDEYILKLAPEEKYFFLYLLTNSHTKQCGIYEIPTKVMVLETGLDKDKIFRYIEKFKKDKKIKFNKRYSEVMILNWLKNNPPNSPQIKACIRKEITELKTKSFVDLFYRLCIEYQYSIHTQSQKEEEKEKEEKEKEDGDEEECEEKKEFTAKDSRENTKSTKIRKKSSKKKPNPLIGVAENCYKENGPDCRLKQNSKRLEEKCIVCLIERQKWKIKK